MIHIKSPFFIIGAQRSGTTLLRLMLNTHSQVAIPEEGTFWMPLLREHKRPENLYISKQSLSNYVTYIQKNAQFHLWNLPIMEKWFDEE